AANAHTQHEQTIRPIIRLLTIQWACQNSVKIDRSDGATSGGIMTHPFGSMATANPAGANARTSQRGKFGPDRARQPSESRVKSMSRSRRLRIPREKCPIFDGIAGIAPTHNAASVVNNRLADAQGYRETAIWADGRTGEETQKRPPARRVAVRNYAPPHAGRD